MGLDEFFPDREMSESSVALVLSDDDPAIRINATVIELVVLLTETLDTESPRLVGDFVQLLREP